MNQENRGPEEKFRIGLSRRTRKLVESSGVNSISTKHVREESRAEERFN